MDAVQRFAQWMNTKPLGVYEGKAAGRLRGNRPKRKSALKDRAFIPRVTDRTIGCSSALRECPVNSRLCGL